MLKRGVKLVPKIDLVLTFGYRISKHIYLKNLQRAMDHRNFDFAGEIIRIECPKWFLLRNSKKCLSGEIKCTQCWNTKCVCTPQEYEIIEYLSIRDWSVRDYTERGISTAQDMINYIESICKERGLSE